MNAGFELAPTPMKNRLGIAAGLSGTGQNQLLGGQKGDAVVEVGCHRQIRGVPGILLIHQWGHPLQASAHILLGDDAMP